MNRLRPPLAVLLFALGAGGTAVAGLAYGARPERAPRVSANAFEVDVRRAQPEPSFEGDLPFEGPRGCTCDGPVCGSAPVPSLARRRAAFEEALAALSVPAAALGNALRGLAESQGPEGLWWDISGCDCDLDAVLLRDLRTTAIAALAFLWAGHTPHDSGSFGKTTADALRALMRAQRSDGSFAEERASPETDPLAALALLEAYAATGGSGLQAPAQRALTHVLRARSPEPETAAALPTWSSLVLDVAREVLREDLDLGFPPTFEIPAPTQDRTPPATTPSTGARVPEGVLAAIGALRRGGAAGDAWADVFERLALTQETTEDADEPLGSWSARDGRGQTETTALFAVVLAAKFRWAPEPGAPGSPSGR